MTDSDQQLVMVGMFPLSIALFPHEMLPLQVFEPRYHRLVNDCQQGAGEFGVVLISRGSEVGGGDQRCSVGTLARIEQATPTEWGRWLLMVRGMRRVRIGEWIAEEPYPIATVEALVDRGETLDQAVTDEAERAVISLRSLIADLGGPPALERGFGAIEDLIERSWRIALAAPLNPYDRQTLLELDDPAARLLKLAELVTSLREDLARLHDAGPTSGE